MKLRLIYTTIALYGCSAYSADLTKQPISVHMTYQPLIIFEGKSLVHSTIYNKLLLVSQTLQAQTKNSVNQNPIRPNQYYHIDRDPQLLQSIIDYLFVDDTQNYLENLSLTELVRLVEEANFWSLNDTLISDIRVKLLDKLYGKSIPSATTYNNPQKRVIQDPYQQIHNQQTHMAQLIAPENKLVLPSDTYHKLLAVSKKLQNQVKEYDTQNIDINREPQLIQHITNYLLASNTQEYLESLSLLDSVRLYEEANFWELDDNTLTDLHAQIVTKLQTKDILKTLCTSKENLDTFINSCDPTTQTTLVESLAISTRQLFLASIPKPSQPMIGHTDSVCSVVVRRDGTILSGSKDNTIKVWKVKGQNNYEYIQTLSGHTGWVNSLVINADDTLFSGSEDGTIKVWKVNAQSEYECVHTLTDHTYGVTSLAIQNNGTLFSGSRDSTVKVWKVNSYGTYECIQTLSDENGQIHSIAIHTDGTLISGSRVIKVWKVNQFGKYECTDSLHVGWVNRIAIDANGTLFVSRFESWANTVSVFKINTQNKLENLQYLIHDRSAIVYTDYTLISIGSLASDLNTENIKIWKVNTQGQYECVQNFGNYSAKTLAMLGTYANNILFLGLDKIIEVWKINSYGKYERIQTLDHNSNNRNLNNIITEVIIPPLSLEQYILVKWFYQSYQDNSKQQIEVIPNHIEALYKGLPESVKQYVERCKWYKPIS